MDNYVADVTTFALDMKVLWNVTSSGMEDRHLSLGSATRDVRQNAAWEFPFDVLGAVRTGERQQIPVYTWTTAG